MARAVHPTLRHAGKPLRIFGYTIPQWCVLGISAATVFCCFLLLPEVWPTPVRSTVGALLVAGPLKLAFGTSESGRGLLERPRRWLHALSTPRDYPPGEARSGPLEFVTHESKPPEEDPYDV